MAELEPRRRLLACEIVVLGRAAMGERFARASSTSVAVRRDGRLAWADALRLDGESPRGAGFGAAMRCATVLGCADAPLPRLELARAPLERQARCAPG